MIMLRCNNYWGGDTGGLETGQAGVQCEGFDHARIRSAGEGRTF